ncbi:MAG: hypothetical protein SFW09_01870 [Hyphomicrobiaceae bacterium]|nr:hypothetical protein [Hyphomicrobiaceae bacterium]
MVASRSPPSWGTLIWNAAKILLVYCAAGPLIGLLVFAVGLSLIAVGGGQANGGWIGPFVLLYGILFAHFVGLAWAGVAAVAAIALHYVVGQSARWIGAASGTVSFAMAVVSGFVRLPAGTESPIGPAIDSLGIAFFGLMAIVHVLAAFASWLLVRGLLRA